MKLLNIACGKRIHKDWVNIDFHKSGESVIPVNVLKGLPFEDNSFDVIYSSHFFEHITKEQADFVLAEIYRVLNKDGIVRIVVPDLENLCREYLEILSNIEKEESKKKYNWITVELLDQLVRRESGGEMGKMFKDKEIIDDKEMVRYIKERVGTDVSTYSSKELSFKDKLKLLNIAKLKEFLLYKYASFVSFFLPRPFRENLLLKTNIGERHIWMYDKYYLQEKLEKAGFEDIKFLKHNESQIVNFESYLLDTNKDGTPYKGVSSLYCEGRKK